MNFSNTSASAFYMLSSEKVLDIKIQTAHAKKRSNNLSRNPYTHLLVLASWCFKLPVFFYFLLPSSSVGEILTFSPASGAGCSAGVRGRVRVSLRGSMRVQQRSVRCEFKECHHFSALSSLPFYCCLPQECTSAGCPHHRRDLSVCSSSLSVCTAPPPSVSLTHTKTHPPRHSSLSLHPLSMCSDRSDTSTSSRYLKEQFLPHQNQLPYLSFF